MKPTKNIRKPPKCSERFPDMHGTLRMPSGTCYYCQKAVFSPNDYKKHNPARKAKRKERREHNQQEFWKRSLEGKLGEFDCNCKEVMGPEGCNCKKTKICENKSCACCAGMGTHEF